MKTKHPVIALSPVVIILLVVSVGVAYAGQDKNDNNTIFRVGAFNLSATEFADGQPAKAVVYIPGSSQPNNWYARQPAVQSSAGAESTDITVAPRQVRFSLSERPALSYELKLSLLLESRSVPALRVSINGRQGKFYLHPKLEYDMQTRDSWIVPTFSHDDLNFSFPGYYLHQGENTIAFQVVEDDGESIPGADLTYDAIELDRSDAPADVRAVSATIMPTLFYKKSLRTTNQLDELVDVFIRYSRPLSGNGAIALFIDGRRYHQTFASKQDFGDEKLEFQIPEFKAGTSAQLELNLDGQTQRQQETINPSKKWTLLVVPLVHLDVGFTDYRAKVAAVQSEDIDEALDLMKVHPGFRYSLDGEWPLEEFMKTRVRSDQIRAIEAIKQGKLSVPAQYANLLTGFPTAETLIRSLYPSADFSREMGTPFDYANITDVATYSWSYASVLASAGVKYFAAGSDNGRGAVFSVPGRLNERSPFWWEGPDGQKVLVWYARSYAVLAYLFGLPPALASGRQTLPLYMQQFERSDYRANSVIVYGSQGEGTDLVSAQAELASQWNDAYAYPRIQYSDFYRGMKTIAEQQGGAIPTVRGDGGPYWEDGIASDAYYAALERQNESRAPSAEKLNVLSSVVNPRIAPDKADLTRAWNNMVLMDEHTWTTRGIPQHPGGPAVRPDVTSMEAVGQLAEKDAYAVHAQELIGSVVRNSIATIAESIAVDHGDVVVFNTLNWRRSGQICLDLPRQSELVDRSTAAAVSVDWIPESNDSQWACFIAPNIPPIGYKVFETRPAANSPNSSESALQLNVIESPYYRVTLDPRTGGVQSIYDKQLRREIVRQDSPYRFGQYLYVTGGDQEPNQLTHYPMALPKPVLQIHLADNGVLESIMRTSYGEVARMKSSTLNTPTISTEIRVYNQEKKIEFVEDIDKQATEKKEAAYFAFPFAVDQPEFNYEIQTGVVNPAKDMYAGAGRGWFSVQHWISAQQPGVSVTLMPLDAPIVTLGDIVRGTPPIEWKERKATIFSYVMNNYWFTNYREAQGGHFRFRYVLTSNNSTNSVGLSRMGWEEATPLEYDQVNSREHVSRSSQALSVKGLSFLNIADPDLLLETWKPAEDGKGTILRFLDIGGQTRTVKVTTPLLHLDSVWLTDTVERNQNPLPLDTGNGFQFTIHPHEIKTVRIDGQAIRAVTSAQRREPERDDLPE